MSKFLPSGHGRLALQLCAAAGVAALLAGCSADSTRLSDPFSNPFVSSSNQPVQHLASSRGIPAGRTPPVVAQALPSSPSTVVASAAPLRPHLTSRYAAPVSGETTGSIEPGPVRSARGAAYGGWTSSGGVPITVGQGETVDVLSKRYGVPPAALLQTNGLTAGDIRPGTNIVVPVYNAVATAPQTAAPRPLAQAEPAPAAAPRAPKLAKASLLKPRPERMAAEAERKAAPAPLKAAKAERPAEKVAKAERPAEKVTEAERPAAKVVEVKEAKHVRPMAKVAEEKPGAHKDVKAKAVAAAVVPAPVKAKAKAEKLAKIEKPVAAAPAPKVAAAKLAPVAKAAPVKTAEAEPAPAAAPAAKADPAPTASVAPESPATADASGTPEFRWPARGRIIQGFKGGNDGINIAVPDGTPVKAAENGTVAYAGSELKGYGNLVLIRHPNGYVTAYANNGELDVKRGDQVKRGQTIAKSGQSGNVSSPQLHFELRKGSTPVDPTSYLAGL
jgi:murein DD-endopeptidase MepM/ murein hydrolase activator NlpD